MAILCVRLRGSVPLTSEENLNLGTTFCMEYTSKIIERKANHLW